MAAQEQRKYVTKSATTLNANDTFRASTSKRRSANAVHQEAAARYVRAYANVSEPGTVMPVRIYRSPLTYSLFGEIRPGWMVVKPLLLTVERDEYGNTVLSDDKFNVYGEGLTPSRAVADYIDSLIEYYELVALRAGEDECTGSLFSYLGQYLRRTLA